MTKISETTFSPKCIECGGETSIKGKCENSKVVCKSCNKSYPFEEYQEAFEDYIEDSCVFEDE
ncbi:hypothetical protein [Desulfatibacillum aliphaticivorans]|uniref:hypothetical protein n=1 Tax=Desulfatibacillum aliphaticivorans TaxID=218208 RepID=UPI000427BB87|nr:hypothetical protein [Desulfatibacillum aliphaticivorans]